MGTYRLRVPASRVGYVPDAQGGLPPGPHVLYVTYGVRIPTSYRTHRAPWHPRFSGWLVITPGDEAREEVAAARAAAEQRAREGVARQRMAAFLAQQEPEPSI